MFLVERNRCLGCGKCAKSCPQGAITLMPWEHQVQVKGKELLVKKVAHIDPVLCACCGECQAVCPNKAILRVPRRAIYPQRGRGRMGRGGGRGRRLRR